MNQRIVLAIAGVVAVVAVVWLTTRLDVSVEVAEQAAPAEAPATTPADPIDSVPAPSVIAGASSGGAPATPELTVSSPLHPIEVSPGFEFLSTPDMQDTDGRYLHWRRHQELQSESRDPAWAPRMEAALRNGIEDALTAQGFDTQRIVLPVVECRTTGCEIQALGYAGDNMKNGADLQLILPPLLGGDLSSEFDPDGTSMILSSREDDRRGVLVQLVRKKS